MVIVSTTIGRIQIFILRVCLTSKLIVFLATEPCPITSLISCVVLPLTFHSPHGRDCLFHSLYQHDRHLQTILLRQRSAVQRKCSGWYIFAPNSENQEITLFVNTLLFLKPLLVAMLHLLSIRFIIYSIV